MNALAISKSLDSSSFLTFTPRIISWDLDALPASISLNNFQVELGLSLHYSSSALCIDCSADFIIADIFLRSIIVGVVICDYLYNYYIDQIRY